MSRLWSGSILLKCTIMCLLQHWQYMSKPYWENAGWDHQESLPWLKEETKVYDHNKPLKREILNRFPLNYVQILYSHPRKTNARKYPSLAIWGFFLSKRGCSTMPLFWWSCWSSVRGLSQRNSDLKKSMSSQNGLWARFDLNQCISVQIQFSYL